MLRGGNPLTVGVGIIIEVIRKNNSDYDPEVGAGQDLPPSSSDPIYLGTLLRLFAKHVPDFTELILSPNHTITSGDSTITVKRKELQVAFGTSIEPLGFDRFKTCELMAELLHCSNMGLLNERGSEAYVKKRDQERERLRKEGILSRLGDSHSAITEFSEDGNGYQNGASSPLQMRSSSPEERRKLEIANSAEDDGFEDVGASGDLSDEIKDDFDEKSPFELESNAAQTASPLRPTRPRMDLDEEFVDEPLTSPHLAPVEDKSDALKIHPESLDGAVPETGSPTSALADKVHDLSFKTTSEASDDKPSDSSENVPATALVDDLLWSFPSHETGTEHGPETSSPTRTVGLEAPPLPHRDRNLSPGTEHEVAGGPPSPLSPHPDDKPAPLFAARSDATTDSDTATVDSSHRTAHTQGSQGSIDTTAGEEGDPRSPLPQNEQSSGPHIETDVDGQPIVGDYLKMMFVEHKVVPTILVSKFLLTTSWTWDTDAELQDFFFRFPWNNFLHNVVYDVVQQVFNGPVDRGYNRSLAIDLFQTGRITERIIEGQLRSDEAQARNNMRLGYMGHLTLIAEEVVKFSERHSQEVLSQAVIDKVTDKLWSDYVEYKLSETRERDAAILGGVRPDLALGPRQAVLNAVNAAHGFSNNGSNALTNAGLVGHGLDSLDLTSSNAGSGTGSLGLGGGSLLSGFGSSSDEEDEEMEEVGEHEEGAESSEQVGHFLFEDVDMDDA
jgi:SIT4-associating protein SAP185/190